jgi:histidinol phosphatase-like PHP family hydrolase
VDIISHPGYITEAEARRAAERGVCLEITSRHGHSLTNGHVARIGLQSGARLVINTDSHAPGDLITRERAFQVLVGAGLRQEEAETVMQNNEDLLQMLKDSLTQR